MVLALSTRLKGNYFTSVSIETANASAIVCIELGAMLDVYDTYGDKKIRDYAIAYADTMVHEDGSITAYKLTDYSLDRINSGKILFRIYEQTKNPKYKKALDLLYSQFEGQPRNEDGGLLA